MKRIYINSPLSIDKLIKLDNTSFHYLFRVLRCQNNDLICAFNGDGYNYISKLKIINKNTANIKVVSTSENNNESKLYTILIQGLSKGDRMDLAIQKSVELGVNEVYPVLTEYSNVRIDDTRKEKKHNHWLSIIRSACSQSERSTIPILHPIQPINSAIKNCHADKKIFLHPDRNNVKNNIIKKEKNKIINSAAVIIGPEGGLSKSDILDINENNFSSISLGSRILRTETATVSALTLMQHLWGDYV